MCIEVSLAVGRPVKLLVCLLMSLLVIYLLITCFKASLVDVMLLELVITPVSIELVITPVSIELVITPVSIWCCCM